MHAAPAIGTAGLGSAGPHGSCRRLGRRPPLVFEAPVGTALAPVISPSSRPSRRCFAQVTSSGLAVRAAEGRRTYVLEGDGDRRSVSGLGRSSDVPIAPHRPRPSRPGRPSASIRTGSTSARSWARRACARGSMPGASRGTPSCAGSRARARRTRPASCSSRSSARRTSGSSCSIRTRTTSVCAETLDGVDRTVAELHRARADDLQDPASHASLPFATARSASASPTSTTRDSCWPSGSTRSPTPTRSRRCSSRARPACAVRAR